MKYRKSLLIKLLILVEVLLIVFAAQYLIGKYGKTSISDDNDTVSKADNVSEEIEVSSEEPVSTLFFASDYQSENGWDDPQYTLSCILDKAIADGKNIDGVIMCGDYSNEYKKYDYQTSPEYAISTIQAIVLEKCHELKPDNIIFEQGNHDALTESISETGLHEYPDYLVYVLNTQYDFPWSQGKSAGCLAKVRKSAEEMETCFNELIAQNEKRPVIIAGHVPLHFSARTSSRHTTGDNLYSSLIFDVVNKAGRYLDIIFLFGHDHSKGWDCYIGGACVYKSVGDEILIPVYNEFSICTDEYLTESLNFTYLNAGYVGYYMNCSENDVSNGTLDNYDAADMTLTGTVCEIYSDRIILTRYDTDGVHVLASEGCADPYNNYIDKGLISEDFYSKIRTSPQSIIRKR